MKLGVIAVGRKMPAWVQSACADYEKRLPSRWRFQTKELAQGKGASSDVIMLREANQILESVSDKAHVVALDNRGASLSTAQLSQQLAKWQELGKNVELIIGGADGLHASVVSRADQMWSLSPLTFPHPLVRVILVEQLYRAQSLLDGHPYHRA